MNGNLERSELHGSVTEGGRVVLCSPEGQPGVLLGAGGPPQVRPGSHRVGVEVVDRSPAVVGLAGPHPEGVELPGLAGQAGLLRTKLLLQDDSA